MTRHIERQIESLKERILRVGTLVEEAISKSITALINRDVALACRVMASDEEIDRMEVEVEEECLKILALYQPVAADLRLVVAMLKINNDLERMGDLALEINYEAVDRVLREVLSYLGCKEIVHADRERLLLLNVEREIKRLIFEMYGKRE